MTANPKANAWNKSNKNIDKMEYTKDCIIYWQQNFLPKSALKSDVMFQQKKAELQQELGTANNKECKKSVPRNQKVQKQGISRDMNENWKEKMDKQMLQHLITVWTDWFILSFKYFRCW